MTKFNQLQTKDDFAKLLGLKSAKYINYLLYNIQTDNLYNSFTIPKKNGGERVIHAPKKGLKFLQKKLSNVLWECYLESIDLNLRIRTLKHLFCLTHLKRGKALLPTLRCIETRNTF